MRSTTSSGSRRLRFGVVAQIALLLASLGVPAMTFASIGGVVVGAQTPNPVTAGSSATYAVTTTTDKNRGTDITAVAGLPAGATFLSDCVVSTATGSVSNTLTITTTGATPVGTSTLTLTVTSHNGTACASAVDATNNSATVSLVVAAAAKTSQTITFPVLAGVRLEPGRSRPRGHGLLRPRGHVLHDLDRMLGHEWRLHHAPACRQLRDRR